MSQILKSGRLVRAMAGGGGTKDGGKPAPPPPGGRPAAGATPMHTMLTIHLTSAASGTTNRLSFVELAGHENRVRFVGASFKHRGANLVFPQRCGRARFNNVVLASCLLDACAFRVPEPLATLQYRSASGRLHS